MGAGLMTQQQVDAVLMHCWQLHSMLRVSVDTWAW